jgi:hypothetical protein
MVAVPATGRAHQRIDCEISAAVWAVEALTFGYRREVGRVVRRDQWPFTTSPLYLRLRKDCGIAANPR